MLMSLQTPRDLESSAESLLLILLPSRHFLTNQIAGLELMGARI